MDKEKLREIAQRGGKNAHNRHRFTSEKARLAGLKGSEIRWGKKAKDGIDGKEEN
jgi:general stress protein YciG